MAGIGLHGDSDLDDNSDDDVLAEWAMGLCKAG